MSFSAWKSRRNRKAQAADKKHILLAEKRRRWGRLNLERLEDRLAPSVASVVDGFGKLAVTITAGAPEDVAISSVAGNVKINGSDPDSGAAASPSIRSIVVTGDPNPNNINFSGVNTSDFTQLVSTLVVGGGGADTIDVTGHATPMTVVKFSDGSAMLTDGSLIIRAVGVQTFVGAQATITEQGMPNWLSEGPSTITAGQVKLTAQNNPVIGAVDQVAIDPFDPNVMFAATVSGGVWRNNDRTVFFATASSTLDPASKAAVDAFATFLNRNPSLMVTVTGFTDNTTNLNPGGNQALSEARGQAVQTELLAQGVPSAQIMLGGTNGGDGENNPLASNATPAGRAFNRRAEMIVNHWTPLTDAFDSLAIGSIAISKFDASGAALTAATPLSQLVIYAGTGMFSSQGQGGAAVGLLISRDGGNTWTLNATGDLGGLNINSVVATGKKSGSDEIVLVSALSANGKTGGLFQSTDAGKSFSQKLAVAADGFGLVADPGNMDRYYAGVQGQGVMISTDDGGSWNPTATQPMDTMGSAATADRVVVAVQPDPANASDTVFVTLVRGGMPTAVLNSTDQGGTWNPFGPAATPVPNSNPGGQAGSNLTMQVTADGTKLFLAGDFDIVSGDGIFSAAIFLGDGATWTLFTKGATVNSTAPHADSRSMTFDAAGRLVETDDGGIARLQFTDQNDPTKVDWVSINADLGITEILSLAYDPLNNVFFAGDQDTGAPRQSGSGTATPLGDPVDLNGDGLPDDFATRSVWQDVTVGDGQQQLAVNKDATHELRFDLANNFNFFTVTTADSSTGAVTAPVRVGLKGTAAGAAQGSGLEVADRNSGGAAGNNFITIPYVVNATNNNRMLIGFFSLYESNDNLDTITPIVHQGGPAFTALAYGAANNADAIYAAKGGVVLLRTTAGGAVNPVTTPVPGSGTIAAIAMDPDDFKIAYVVRGSQIFMTTDNGTTAWTDVSQKLPAGTVIRSLSVVKDGGLKILVAATNNGVFRAITPAANVIWTRFGLGMPNAVVSSTIFTPRATSDVLGAGTQGRGAWAIYGDVATQLGTASTLTIDGTAGPNIYKIIREAGNPLLVDIFVNSVTPLLTLPLSSIQSLVIHTGGVSDSLFVDSANGALSFPGGISIDGATTSVELDNGVFVSQTASSTATTTTTVVTLQGGSTESTTTDIAVTPLNNLTAASNDVVDGTGLGGFFNWLNQVAILPTTGSTTQPELALLGTSLFDAVMGEPATAPAAESDQGGPAGPGAGANSGVEGFLRLIETGTGAFNIGAIGTTITTFAQLQTALQNLGATNIVGSDLTSVSFQLVKPLSGQADLHSSFSFGGGQVALDGNFALQAQLTLHLSFGVDGTGFFIDTAGTSLAIDHIALNGDGHAVGHFGFLDVQAGLDQLTIDPSVGLTVSLSGGKLRLADLTGSLGAHVTVAASGNSGHDIALKLDVKASALIPGTNAIDLGGAKLTVNWANVSSPTSASITANAGFASDVLDFLKVDVQQVRDEIAKLTNLSDALHVNIPFVSNALGDVLNLVNFIDNKIVSPVTAGGSTANFATAQTLASELIQGLGIDPSVLNLGFDATNEVLTYHLHLNPSVMSQPVNLGNGLNLAQGLADLNFSATGSANANLMVDATFGIDIKAIVSGQPADKWFFIKDASASGTLDLSASNVNADARFGFLSISVFQGSINAHAGLSVTLKDPGNDGDGRIDIGELIDGLTHLGDLVSANVSGNAMMQLPIKAPFLGITSNTPSADNTLVVNLPDFTDFKTATVTIPPAIQNVGNFAHIDAASFVGLMGQVTGALDQFRRSGTFANFNVPLLGPALDKVLALNEAFRNALLIDEGADGTIDGSDQLDTVINNALKAAGLDSKLHAETSGGKVQLLANDFSGTSFTLSAPGGNGLGFGTTQTSSNLTANGPQAITASSTAPANGQLASDVTFQITFAGGGVTGVAITNPGSGYTSAPTVSFSGGGGTGAAGTATIVGGGVTAVIITNPGTGYTSAPTVNFSGGGGSGAAASANAVTVHASDTSSDTGLGDDHWKLVDANNAATFATVDQMAIRIAQILNLPNALHYNPTDQTLTFTLNLTPTFGQIDLPLNFNLNLSPLLQLTSNSSLRLTADGSLNLTVGVYLGNAPSSSMLDPTKPLSAINGGVTSKTDKVITGTSDVRTVYGQLSADASFALSVNGGAAKTVTITKSSTLSNTTAADLATEITAALSAAGISNVTASAIGNRILLVGAGSVTAMHLSASSGNTAVSEIGFGVSQDAALEIIAPVDAPASNGQLSADASLQITINGGAPTTVTVTQAATSGNSSVGGLVSSINAALKAAALDTKLQAVAIGNRVALQAIDASVTSIHLSASSGNTAVTGIGFGTSQDAVLQAVATNDLPTLWGRLTDDATFNVSLNTVNSGAPIAVTVTKASAASNRFTFDIVNEVQTALDANAALKGKITAGFSNNRLTLTAPGTTSFSLTATGTAASELGLGMSNTGNDYAFYITTQDGSKYGISLDGLSTLSDLLSAISTQTSGKVTAALNDKNTGINLTDSSSGGTMFAVTSANNSNAAATLGILRQNAQLGVQTPGVIDGTDIAGLTPGDRFFLQDVSANVGLHLTSPSGLNLAAHLGFLNIGLSGNATISANLGLNLKDPGTDGDNRISLTELFNSLSDISTLLNAPSLTGSGDISLTVSVNPALPGLTVSSDPIVLHINSWGNPFANPATAPDVSLTVPPDLVAFNNPDFSFQNVLSGLQALTNFLGQFSSFGFLSQPIPLVNVSVKDLVNLADKFSTALDQAAANPAGTVQALQDQLKEAFGIPKASNALTLALFTDGSQYFLRITIDLNKAFTKSLSVNMDLGGGLMLGGSAGLAASGNLDAKLDFGIDLHNPTNIDLFDQTGITASLTGTASALNFKAAIGPAGIFVENGNATVTVGASGGIKNSVFTNHHVALTTLLSALGDDLSLTPSGSIHATLPVFFPTETRHAGDITFNWNDISDTNSGDANGPHLVVPNNLLSIDPSQFSFLDELGLGVDGIDLFLGGLQDLVDGSLGGVKLPLVGKQLAGVANVIGDFRNHFVEPLRTAIDDLANPSDAFAQSGTDPVSKILYKLLGPSGLNLLEDSNGDGSVGPDDIVFDGNINQQGVALTNLFVHWHFKLGGTIVSANPGIGFDVGIPGLGLSTTGNLSIQLAWSLQFGFGLSAKDGFSIDVGPNSGLRLDLDVSVPGGSLTGTLGFLQLTAKDHAADPTHLGATFGIGIVDSRNHTNTKLSFADLGNIDIVPMIGAEAVVDLDAKLSLSNSLIPDAATNFPSVVAEFVLDWSLGDRHAANGLLPLSSLNGDFLSNGLQFVGFKNVGLDLGSYFSDFIEPIAKKIQEYTAPIKPFLDFITAPIPVISQLAGPTSLLDIAQASGEVSPEFVSAIKFIDQIVDIANQLVIPNTGNIMLMFGSGEFPIFDNRGGSGKLMLDLTNPSSIGDALTSGQLKLPSWADLGGLQNALNAVAPVLQDAIASMAAAAGAAPKTKLSLPIIEDPSQIFGMLLGKHAVLIDLNLAPLDIKASFSAFFSILGPLGVSINADFMMHIHFDFGYDTLGIEEFAKGGFKNPLTLFDGFFINDVTPNGQPEQQLVFDAGLWAAAELNLGVARGGVGGGLFAHIQFHLHNADKSGRVRIKDLVTEIVNEASVNVALAPLAIFDISGNLKARLFAFLKIDLFLFHIDKMFDITSPVTLLDFQSNFYRPPTLATDLGDGVLQLNLGANAAQRIEGSLDGDSGEKFYVKQGSDASHVKVWAPDLGVSEAMAQEYECTKEIIAKGGKGNDIIDCSGVTSDINYDLEDPAGDNLIKAGTGHSHATLVGGSGDDTLWGDNGGDIIVGGPGHNEIHALGGNNIILGNGSLKDIDLPNGMVYSRIRASDAASTIYGGSGSDIIIGDGGDNEIHGGGHDLILGAGGKVAFDPMTRNVFTVSLDAKGLPQLNWFGGVVDVTLTDKGVGGHVKLWGGSGDNLIYGGSGNVEIHGGAGHNIIYTGPGNDLVYGGNAGDAIYGGPGQNTIHGGSGSDLIHAGTGNDYVDDTGGNNWIYGDAGNNTLIGGPGNDHIFGGTGDNLIYGGGGNDYLQAGSTGMDKVYGYSPSDHTLTGNDTLVGGSGDDFLDGGNGADTYLIYAHGGDIDRQTYVYDSGTDGATDTLIITAPIGNDSILFRAMADYYYHRYYPSLTMVVTDVTITNPGGGYTSPPTVSFTGGGGSGAAGIATIMGGGVTGVTITNPGSGYTSPPTVSFTGGGGSGAAGSPTTAGGLTAAVANVFNDPTINDPLGFGPAPLSLSTSPTTLSPLAPPSGKLTANVNFSISDGTYTGVGILHASDTAAFSGLSQLVTALQGAVNAALANLHAAGSSNTTTITVGQSGGHITFTANASGLTIQAIHDLDALKNAVRSVYNFNQMFDVPDGMLDALTAQYGLTPNNLTQLENAISGKYIPYGLAYLYSLAKTPFNNASLSNSDKLAQIQQAMTNAYFPASVPAGMLAALAAADITSFSSIEAAIASTYTTLATDTGFVAFLNNGGMHVERFNYRNITSLVLDTIQGDNHIVLDDVIGATTINLGLGNSRVQVGQVFNSQRVGDFNALITGIQPLDAFGTLPITRGWLSNGISQPTTINGGPGNDQFTVFHNVAVLTLNGGTGDDLFTIRSFALLGSIDSTRARTDIKGGGGNDTILYVSNAPVNIEGGSGFNTLRVIGTEFADDYIVTDKGIFGAGLNVNYVNIQKVIVDGAEGNDRFFVFSTAIDTVTELDGDLGSNTFFIGGDPQGGAPIPVVSNDLRGYSGVIQHGVTSNDPSYNGIAVDGLSANIEDNNESNIIVTETDGYSRVTRGATSGGQHYQYDSYTLRLSRPPKPGMNATINVVVGDPSPANQAMGAKTLEFWNALTSTWVPYNLLPPLIFDSTHPWNVPQTVKYRAALDIAEQGTRFVYINNTAQHSTDPDYANAKIRSAKVQVNDNNKAGVLITPAGLGLTVLEGGFTDAFNVQLTRPPTANVMVTLTLANNYLNLASADARFNAATRTITFTSADYNMPVAITVSANADGVAQGFHTDFISYTVSSADVAADVPVASYLVNGDFNMGDNFMNPLPIPSDLPTPYLYLRQAPDLSQPVTIVYNNGSGDVTLTPSNPSDQSQQSDDQIHYTINGNLIDFYKDGMPVAISGSIHASYSYVKAGYNNLLVKDSVVDIYDADTSMVIVRQTTGSTNVIEADPTSSDTYTVQLSRAPAAGTTVTVTANSIVTRASNAATGAVTTGQHVYVNGSLSAALTFTSANWNIPQTVTVTAITDNSVNNRSIVSPIEGDDTKVFVPGLQTTHKIRGPLILNGAGGSGSLSLPAPLLLPGEQNIRPFDGQVVGFTAGSGPGAIETMTVNKTDLVNKLPAFAGSNPPINTILDLVGKTIELTQGPGTGIVLDPSDPYSLFNRFWLINGVTDLGNGQVQLTLQNPTRVDPSQPNVTAPTSATKYAVTSLSKNFFDDPRKDINFLMVFDNDSVASENGALTSSTGNVLSFAPVSGATDQMTVNTVDLQAIQSINNNLNLLIGRTLNISVGPGLGRTWTIAGIANGTSPGTKVLTLTEVSGSGTPTNRSEFRIAGIGNTRGRITGFGMGPNIVVGNTIQSGGITYSNMEVVRMDLGNGNNNVLVDYTSNSADGTVKRTVPFYTLTMLNTGSGNNKVTINLKDGEDGAFALNFGSGNDYADGSQSTLGLVIFGGLGNNTLKGGSGNDIIFGSLGRVDYVNGAGFIVTRLGFSEKLDPVNPNPTSATATTLTDTATTFYQGHAFATRFGGFVGLSIQAISPAGDVQFRTIVANTADTVTIDRPWDTIPDATWTYRVSTLPEDQTDGTFRGPQLITSVFNDQGGNNTIYETGGNNTIIAGAGNDTVYGGTGNDIIVGNDAVLNYAPVSGNDGPTRLVSITPGTVAGNNFLYGGGNDTIIGGLGNDFIHGGAGTNILVGDNAYIHYNDTQIVDQIQSINANQGGNDTIYGGLSDNTILGGAGNDTVYGGNGNDIIIGNDAVLNYAPISGSDGPTRLVSITPGTAPGDNHLYGGGGNDTIIGGLGNDYIRGGMGTNILVGDNAYIHYNANQIVDHIESINRDQGGNNTIYGGPHDDIIIGGPRDDSIDGGAGKDLIFANNALLDRTTTLGDYRNPRFRVLSGTQIYSTNPATAGQALIDPTRTYVDPRGAAWWADFQITLLDHDTSTPSTRYGNNYIAGGPGDKMIFGGLGSDTIQGHGSIDLKPKLYFWGADQQIIINRLLTLADIQYNPGDPADVARATRIIAQINSGRVGAWRFIPTASFVSEIRSANNLPATWGSNLSAMVTGYLFLRPSFEDFDHFDANGNPVSVPGNDGSSYIEGGGGNDVIFGDGGQNDIIGGNSDQFSLTTRTQRPSGSNLIFGGAGTDISRNDPGDTTPSGHAHDSDMIISNNGDIFRLVGVTVNGQVMLAPMTGASSVGGVATFNGFLAFNYDNYSNQMKIIPRAAKLLDYTPGGPAFNATAAAQDIGGSTEIHGENGDNFIFGEKGNNWIYGGGQDNQIVAGYGTNWISGGAGNAAIIGQDGRIFASRNGLAEPLNGVTAIPANQLNLVISTPGKVQSATINVAGQLKSTVDLEPFSEDVTWNASTPEWNFGFNAPHQSDDIIFGGIGNDTVHGGSGDDAISGGEALPLSYLQTYNVTGNLTGVAESDWYQPYNPGNALRFNPIDPSGTHSPRQVGRTGQFALYDEFDPRRKVLLNSDGTANKTGTGLPWFLDLNANDGPLDPRYPASANIHTDGNDNLFGDLGNNWIVAGTGQNDLFGGFGNDLLDARSSQDINGGLNDMPNNAVNNTNRAYGGAGKDVLIADSAADRLIDWVGNFNTYIVPFSPWGSPTVSRQLDPRLPQFLYDLSRNDGSDQTLAADYGADPTRNGEPFGELGLVLQHDAAWRDQTGAPSDQPPGNIGGSKRDTKFASSFTSASAAPFIPDSGTWTPGSNLYLGSAAANSDAVSLLYLDQWLPSYVEYQGSLKLTSGGAKQNGFLIFDYQNSTDFKYAGVDALTGKLRIGWRSASGWNDLATLSSNVKLNAQIWLEVILSGATAQLLVGNSTLSYTFANPLNTGLLALGVDSSVTNFTWAQVQVLPKVFTYQVTPAISSTGLAGFTVQSGQGSVSSNRYNLTPPVGDAALSTRPLNVVSSSYVEYQATVNAAANGTWAGLVFGYTDSTGFLFAAIVPGTNQVILGHRNPAGWFVDAVATRTVTAGTDNTLLIALDNAPVGGGNPTVNVVLNGQTAISFGYSFPTVGGLTQGNLQVGLLARNGAASFYNLSIRGNDPAYVGGGTPQLAATPAAISAATVSSLQPGQLQPIIAAAIDYWTALPAYQRDAALLEQVPFAITYLPGVMIGQTIADTIVIDPTAAGFGWFVDSTPFDSTEFNASPGHGPLQAAPSSPAYGRMDLLTVVMHEFGHVLGYDDIASGAHANDLMGTWLQPGVRRFPGETQFVAAAVLPRPAHISPYHVDAAFAPLAAKAAAVLPRDDVALAETARLLIVQPPTAQPGSVAVAEQEPPPDKGALARVTQIDAVLAAYSATAPTPHLTPAPSDNFAQAPALADDLVAEIARLWQRKD